MPDGEEKKDRLYFKSGNDGVKTAKWYDALELMDYYKSIKTEETEREGLAYGKVPD